MSFKCQIFPKRLTFNKNVFVQNCDVRLIIILCLISAILPIIKCAKLENPQIRLLINDDELLQEKTNIHEAGSAAAAAAAGSQHDSSGEHFNLYRSELKRLSYETIHRILRDENEPSYRREDTELRYYQKRSPSYEESHQLIKRSTKEKEHVLSFSHKNLTEFVISSQLKKRLNLVSSLDLSHNYISQLNTTCLLNISSLTSLNLQNNSFTFIPLSPENTLRTLNLNHNLIKTSSLNSNIYLRNLYLSHNLIENLSAIPLALLKNLESLDISHNQLKNSEASSFFMERMHNLKHLNLAFNQLGSIYRETFYNLLSLNTLLLSHNNISDIDYETFLALPNLQYLDLSFNGLKGKSIRALQGITGLVALNIAFNPDIGGFMQEFVASWSLKELDASGTGLCQIPAALAQSVRSLKLTHNWLKVINCGDLDSYPLLQYLDLSFSHIEHIEDDALGRLEILEILMLDHNKLDKIPYSLPVSLEHLFLQNNDIMEIPQQAFQGLNNLKTLDLSHNKLLYLPDIVLPKLLTLNLQSSKIRGISQGIIHSLPKLNELMLEDNPIKCADLLGIAEWASTCRLRGEKDVEGVGDGGEVEADNLDLRLEDLKMKFEKMHNFYEQFEMNSSNVNNSFLSNLKAPICVKENLNSKQFGELGEQPKKSLDHENFNQNSTSFRSLLKTEKTFMETNNNNPTNAVSKSAIGVEEHQRQQEQQHRQQSEKLQIEEAAVKTITIEKPSTTQTLSATMQSSILNEKQTFNTTTESYNTNAMRTTAATTTNNNSKAELEGLLDKGNEGPKQQQQDIVVNSKFRNTMKTFENSTKIPDDDEDLVATTTISTTTNQQQHLNTMRENTTFASSLNMTQVKEKNANPNKEMQQHHQQHFEDLLQRTIETAQTFQTIKSKKWLKQENPLKALEKGFPREMPQNMEILFEHNKTKEINAAQFIKSTFAPAKNSKIHETTKAFPTNPSSTTATFRPATATVVTTTMAKAFRQKETENKHVKEEKEEEVKFKTPNLDAEDLKAELSKLQEINLKKPEEQHKILTNFNTTKEIKSLETQITATELATTADEPLVANKRITKITLKIPPELTGNLDNSNSESKEFIEPSSGIPNNPTTTTQTMTLSLKTTAAFPKTTHKSLDEKKPDLGVKATATTETFTTIETKNPEEATPNKSPIKAKDSGSDNKSNNRQITETLNKTSNILGQTRDPATTRPNTSPGSSNTNTILSTTTTKPTTNPIQNNKNIEIVKTFDVTTDIFVTDHHQHPELQQQKQQLNQSQHFEIEMPHHRQLSLEKDVNVKCMQSNSNECNSAVIEEKESQNSKLDFMPTMEATKEEQEPTTKAKTSIEIPTAVKATMTTTTTTTAIVHKHEPLQLLVKDRHLIGTPLLMHKGENLMVTADELILPTSNNHNAPVQDEGKNDKSNSNNNNSSKERHDLETNTKANDSKNKHNLDSSQTTRTLTASAIPTTESTPNQHLIIKEHKINKSSNKKGHEDIKIVDFLKQEDLEKIKKPNYEIKTKKPSLIMKKMTIITKQHEDVQHEQALEPLENEVHVKQFDNSHYQELKPLLNLAEKEVSLSENPTQIHSLKHSTVNTPISSHHQERPGQAANLLKQPHTFQHEHELLIQQILQDQQAENHAKLTKTEQWSDLRKAENKENHPGLILLVSSGLFLVLLLGLMHVYRCDMPWRRHSPSHHLRPHQRQNHSLEDDSHSFLSYSEGMQKWHHSTRQEAPYNSPLHHLHVRELQKTSATEKPANVKSSVNFKAPPLSHSITINNSRSLSQSSTTTTSTNSNSSSAILDDESFYIEMTPDSGQFSQALQSELLPMELLNMNQLETHNNYHEDALGDSQTSMEDEFVVHYQSQLPQQHPQRHQSHVTSSTNPSASSKSALSATTSSASLSARPQSQTRKFGLW